MIATLSIPSPPLPLPQLFLSPLSYHSSPLSSLPSPSALLEDHVVLIVSSADKKESVTASTLMLPIVHFIKAVRAQVH